MMAKMGRPLLHRKCEVGGCGAPHAARGFCYRHYRAFRRNGSKMYLRGEIGPTGPQRKGCSIEGCERTHKAKGLCRKHYNNQYLFGHPMALGRKAWTQLHGEVQCQHCGNATIQMQTADPPQRCSSCKSFYWQEGDRRPEPELFDYYCGRCLERFKSRKPNMKHCRFCHRVLATRAERDQRRRYSTVEE